MEPTVIFTILVFSVGALHLVWQAAGHIGKFHQKNLKNLTSSKRKNYYRDDWYVFFHRSDLTGTRSDKDGNISVGSRPSATSVKRRTRSRRPVVMARPR
jgi:hypothetical protein